MFEIAIVGAGPWGLAVLDRLVMTALQRPDQRFAVHLIDAEDPGPGLHRPGQDDCLLLNTVAGQIDSFSARHFSEAPLRGAMPFLDWLHATSQTEAGAHCFLPRATFGAYLRRVHSVLRDNAPRNLVLHNIRDTATAISQRAGGMLELCLRRGPTLTVDHVFLCTGHGLAAEPLAEQRVAVPLNPYPPAALQERIKPGAAVGISGMGLVAVDVVALLTEGRGGRFAKEGEGRLRYQASGREPVMFMYSRTGTPFACRPSVSLDLSTVYEPLFCTGTYLAARKAQCGAAGLQLDEDVLAPLCAEMRAAWLLRALTLTGGEAVAAAGRKRFKGMPVRDVQAFCAQLLPRSSGFRPEDWLMPPAAPQYRSCGDYTASVAGRLAFDVAESRKGEAESPYKFGVEMLRVLRPFIREAVGFDALARTDRRRFFEQLAPRISQLVVGPPLARGRQWLALMQAGLLKLDLGPSPRISRDHARGLWRAQSSCFDNAYATCLDHLVLGRARHAGPSRTGTSLLSALYRAGLCSATAVQGDDEVERLTPRIDRAGHPIDATGQPVPGMTLLGVPAEGVSYFNHYLPSPRSRARAWEQIQACLDGLLGQEPVQERVMQAA